MSKISVIMSVYNTKEEWLRESIESILSQTFSDFEFIIINDGSSNNVEEIILSYKDERIKYIKQENQGLAKSLNYGLKIAQGEYIARMDSDDISLPDRFKKQIDFLDKNKDISVLGTWFEFFPKKYVLKHPEKICYLNLLTCCCIGHPTVMFRRSDFEKYNLRYDSEYKCEDYELWSRAIRYLKFANIQEVLLKYRWHENNLSKPTEDFVAHDRKIKQNMLDFLTNDVEIQNKIEQILIAQKKEKLSFCEKLFSVKNSADKVHKLLTIFGIRIKFKRKHKYKIVKLMGGLGNQMFQYAFGKALEQKTNTKVLYDKTWFEEAKKDIVSNGHNSNGVKIRPYDLDVFNLDLDFANTEQINKNKNFTAAEKNAFAFDKRLFKKKYGYFDGYYQNEEYLINITELIKKDFSFPEISVKDKFNNNIAEKIKSCANPVFIHIRRGDYLNLAGWTLSDSYYHNAVQEIVKRIEDPTFFVFGQDCEDYIKNELGLTCNYEYVGNHNSEQGNDYIDMQLMSMCKHGIIANSTFSWWAAWLIDNKNKVVIAPTPWLNNSDSIICDSWVKVRK